MSGPDALLVAALLLLGVRLLSVLPSSFSVDTWLELNVGRVIWNTGVPHHDTLTVLTLGKSWIDQQWLAQLLSYSIYRIGGLALLGLVNVALLISGLSAAVVTARRLGATVREVLIPLVLCGWLFLPGSEVRTQAFAFPLFALTVYLLAVDSRRPSRRVYLTLPLLLVWANLHGSATLGSMLIALRGLTLIWERRRELRAVPTQAIRPLVLVVAAPLCLLATPYGVESVAYYQSTMGNGALRQLVPEWQPVTSSPFVALPFFLLAGLTIWSFLKPRAAGTPWERLALIILALASALVVRNVVFFALAALAMLPASLGGFLRSGEQPAHVVRRRTNTVLVLASLAVTAGVGLSTLRSSTTRFERSSASRSLVAAVARAARADSSLKLVSDTRYADFLLWKLPWLAGRIAEDVRYELYPAADVDAFQKLFAADGADWKRPAHGYGLLVLARPADGPAISGFLHDAGARVLYADRETVVILSSRSRP